MLKALMHEISEIHDDLIILLLDKAKVQMFVTQWYSVFHVVSSQELIKSGQELCVSEENEFKGARI